MISRTVDYALRAVVHLAVYRSTPQTTQQISELTQVPIGYLSKVLQHLVRANVVQSQRGIGGGFVLKQAPENITILQIARAFEPSQRIHQCPLGLEEHKTRLCALHQRLDDAIRSLEDTFQRTTIQDLLGAEDDGPMCLVGEGTLK